jgi:two-component system, NarL family, response regulator NreC
VPASLVLVEDHLAYRQSLRVALATFDRFAVVGEAATAREAYDIIEACSPDLAVIDFLLPDTDGISLARELRRRRLRTKLMILGRKAHASFLHEALRAGISGYVLKQQSLDDVVRAMDEVLSGRRYLGPELEKELLKPLGAKAQALESLSSREREILFLLMEGLSTKEIAKALFLSPKTVDAHRLHINRKLGVRSPAALTRFVAGEGLISS